MFESRFSDWWFDESVDLGHESRLGNTYEANMERFRTVLMGSVRRGENRLAEGRSQPGYEDADKRSIQGDLLMLLRLRYSLGVPIGQLVVGFHELVNVIGEDETMAQAEDALWIFAWAALVGDQRAKDTLKRVAPLSYLQQHPSFISDVFLGVEPISELPFYTTPKGKLLHTELHEAYELATSGDLEAATELHNNYVAKEWLKRHRGTCLLYTSPSPRDQRGSRMPSSA